MSHTKIFFALFYICFLVSPSLGDEPKQAPLIPGRFSQIKPKLARLEAAWGSPEQTPAGGHVAALTPDGQFGLFVLGSVLLAEGETSDSYLCLWDAPAGRLLHEIHLPKLQVTALALSPDGKRALTGLHYQDGKKDSKPRSELCLWDLTTGKKLQNYTIDSSKGPIIGLALSSNGQRALASQVHGALTMLDTNQDKPAKTLSLPKDTAPLGLLFTADGKNALTGHENHTIALWDLEAGKVERSFKGHSQEPFFLTLSQDGKHLASGAFDNTVRVWDVASGNETAQFLRKELDGPLVSCAFTDQGQILAVWSGADAVAGNPERSLVSLLDPATKKEIYTRKSTFKGLTPVALHGKTGRAIVGGGANPFCSWNVKLGVEEKRWGGHKAPVLSLGVSSKGHVFSGGQDGELLRWEKNGTGIHHYGHADAILGLGFDATGALLTASADKTAKLWDSTSGEILHTFKGHDGPVTSVAAPARGAWAATGSADRTLKTWNLQTGKNIATFTGHSEGVNAVAISPDGAWLASAGEDHTVRLWPIKDGQPDKSRENVTLEGHSRPVTCLAFTAQGQLLSGGQDKTLLLWDLKKEEIVRKFGGHANWITSILVDKGRVISTSDDFTARIWDLNTGKELEKIELTQAADSPRCVAFLSASNSLFVGTAGWMVLRFDVTGVK